MAAMASDNFQDLFPELGMHQSKITHDNATILSVVKDLNCDQLIEMLPDSSHQPRLSPELMKSVFFAAVESMLSTHNAREQPHAVRMIYLLRNLGAQINKQDENGNTALLQYLKTSVTNSKPPDVKIVEAFLRCNADPLLQNKMGETAVDLVTSDPGIPEPVREMFFKYIPGVWEAVERDDAMNVRKLINQWCRVDVQKNGKTLLQLSLEIGTENIVRVISGIRASMEFAHSVLAGDTRMVRRMLRLKLKININFRNLGDRGKTPVYYALEQGNSEMVHTLLDRGARLDIALKGEHTEVDIPLYFLALEKCTHTSTQLLKDVTPMAPIRVDCLFYKGRNILYYCVDRNVGEHLVDFILSKSSAYLVTQRVEQNKCPRQYALAANCHWMVQAIDKAVIKWVYEDEAINRQILVHQGYQYIPAALEVHSKKHIDEHDTFYRYLHIYQEQICQLHNAVEECDEETVRHIIYFRHPDDHSLDPCLADSRRPGDGQPLLHKAVLRGSVSVAQLLAETLVYQRKQRLDSIRDQFFRTALHYAYAMDDNKELVNLLLDYGASEFTMDKDNRSPLAFRDRQGQEEMQELLQYQYLQDFMDKEPDPWSIALPIPIMDQNSDSSSNCSYSNNRPYLIAQQSLDLGQSFALDGPYFSTYGHSGPQLTITESVSSKHGSPLANSHKYKSVSDTKLHRLSPTKHGITAHLAHFPDVFKSKSRITKRSGSKCSVDVVHKEYLPVPSDAPRDSEDDYDYDEDAPDSRDLLDEKEIRKSTSCCVQ